MKACCFCQGPLHPDPGFGVCEECSGSIRKEMVFEGDEPSEHEDEPKVCECNATIDEVNVAKRCGCCKSEGCSVCLPQGECEECFVENAQERAKEEYESDKWSMKRVLEKRRASVQLKHQEELQNAFK